MNPIMKRNSMATAEKPAHVPAQHDRVIHGRGRRGVGRLLDGDDAAADAAADAII